MTHKISWVESPESEIKSIRNVDLLTTAIVNREFESIISYESSETEGSSNVTLLSYHPEGSVYETQSDEAGIMVFSEVWYGDGWTAYIDGVETPLFRANYILRAIELPRGEHTVELKFELLGRKLAGLVNGFGSIFLLLFLLGTMFYAIKK